MSRRVSLPERALSSEDTGLDPVVDDRVKSGSVSSDDGDPSQQKQGKFFKSLTRSLEPAAPAPKKKDYLEEYHKYKAKRAFNLHGVVKQQTIDLGTLGVSSKPPPSNAPQNRRVSTGTMPPQSNQTTIVDVKSSTLPTTRGSRGPPPPVAPRKKSVNLPPIAEPSPSQKLPSPVHETPSYILSAARKEQQRAELEKQKAVIDSQKTLQDLTKQENNLKEENLSCRENVTPTAMEAHVTPGAEKPTGIQVTESTGETKIQETNTVIENQGVVSNNEGEPLETIQESNGDDKQVVNAKVVEDTCAVYFESASAENTSEVEAAASEGGEISTVKDGISEQASESKGDPSDGKQEGLNSSQEILPSMDEKEEEAETKTDFFETEGGRTAETKTDFFETEGGRTAETKRDFFETEGGRTAETKTDYFETEGGRTAETKTEYFETEGGRTAETKREFETEGGRTAETKADYFETEGGRTAETKTDYFERLELIKESKDSVTEDGRTAGEPSAENDLKNTLDKIDEDIVQAGVETQHSIINDGTSNASTPITNNPVLQNKEDNANGDGVQTENVEKKTPDPNDVNDASKVDDSVVQTNLIIKGDNSPENNEVPENIIPDSDKNEVITSKEQATVVNGTTNNQASQSTESTPISGNTPNNEATGKLSKTADLLLSFSQDKTKNLDSSDTDLTGIGEELKKLNSSIEELSVKPDVKEGQTKEDVEKLNELDRMRKEMETMQTDLDMFG